MINKMKQEINNIIIKSNQNSAKKPGSAAQGQSKESPDTQTLLNYNAELDQAIVLDNSGSSDENGKLDSQFDTLLQ